MNVELINIPSEITDASLKQYLADCVSVVRNAQPKDNERLFQRLLKESYGGKASRVFEFIPCTIKSSLGKAPPTQIFGFFEWDKEWYHSNARELLNWGMPWEEIIPLVDFTNYKTVKVTAPYFVYGQVSTHNEITSVSHSKRYTEAGLGYWMPEEIKEYWRNRGETFVVDYDQDELQEQWNTIVRTYSPNELELYMKRKGVTRREIYARGSDMLEYRVATLGGYTNNPNAWEHFINQRLYDPHTQKETRELTAMIAEVIK